MPGRLQNFCKGARVPAILAGYTQSIRPSSAAFAGLLQAPRKHKNAGYSPGEHLSPHSAHPAFLVFHIQFFNLYVSISACNFPINSSTGIPERSLIIPIVAMGSITFAIGVLSIANFSLTPGKSSISFG